MQDFIKAFALQIAAQSRAKIHECNSTFRLLTFPELTDNNNTQQDSIEELQSQESRFLFDINGQMGYEPSEIEALAIELIQAGSPVTCAIKPGEKPTGPRQGSPK